MFKHSSEKCDKFNCCINSEIAKKIIDIPLHAHTNITERSFTVFSQYKELHITKL